MRLDKAAAPEDTPTLVPQRFRGAIFSGTTNWRNLLIYLEIPAGLEPATLCLEGCLRVANNLLGLHKRCTERVRASTRKCGNVRGFVQRPPHQHVSQLSAEMKRPASLIGPAPRVLVSPVASSDRRSVARIQIPSSISFQRHRPIVPKSRVAESTAFQGCGHADEHWSVSR